jgi:hypothetical protein
MMNLWQLFGGMTGAGLKSGAQIYGGFQANDAAIYAADNAEIAGGQAVAASQRKAQEELKRSRYIQSDALAKAAASGAGASDPTVVDIISRIAGEGAYRSSLALYEGAEANRAYQIKADNLRYEGKAARSAAIVNGLTGFGATFFNKYGGGGPTGSSFTGSNGMGAGEADPYGWGMS